MKRGDLINRNGKAYIAVAVDDYPVCSHCDLESKDCYGGEDYPPCFEAEDEDLIFINTEHQPNTTK